MKRVLNWVEVVIVSPVLLYRLLKFGYTFRKIYLGQGIYTLVDVKDYFWLKEYKWIVYGNGNNFYAMYHKIIAPNETRPEYMHRLIAKPPPGLLVDHHENGSLDNRRSNLRHATPAQNMHNRRKKRNTTSQFRGVWRLANGKYESQISNKGKKVHLGWFDSEIQAAKAFDEAAKKYHGEFARLNFPDNHKDTKAQRNINHGLRGLIRIIQPICREVMKGFKILYSLFRRREENI